MYYVFDCLFRRIIMKNILYLHAGAEFYGADKILFQLVTNLDRRKYNPIVVLPNDGILVDKLKKKNIQTYVIEYPILRRKYFNLQGIKKYISTYRKSCRQIINLLRQNNINIDIIHVNTTAVLEGIYLKRKLKAKLLWHVHEITSHPKVVFLFLCLLLNVYADKIITVSKATYNHLQSSHLMNKNKMQVIYNGVNSNDFSPEVKFDYLFNEWNVPRDSLRIGMIGRVNAWKGQNDFLNAFTPLLDEISDLYLFIVGSAFSGQEWRVKELKNKISVNKNVKRIIYSPFRNDIQAVQNFFDILILPSTDPDPLPTVVLEAMASGKTVIGYNHGGITEMVEDKVTGMLAQVNNPVSLREKVKVVLANDQYIEMGKKARERQMRLFSIKSFINNFEKVYASL